MIHYDLLRIKGIKSQKKEENPNNYFRIQLKEGALVFLIKSVTFFQMCLLTKIVSNAYFHFDAPPSGEFR